MASDEDFNGVKYYISVPGDRYLQKGALKASQLLIGRPICRGLPISMKRTISLLPSRQQRTI